MAGAQASPVGLGGAEALAPAGMSPGSRQGTLPMPVTPATSTTSAELCRFFARGWCAFGERCRNSHDTAACTAVGRKGTRGFSSARAGGSLLHSAPAQKPSGGIIHAGPAPKSFSSSNNVALLYARRGAPGVVAAGREVSQCAASLSEEPQSGKTIRPVRHAGTKDAPDEDHSPSRVSQVAQGRANSGEAPVGPSELRVFSSGEAPRTLRTRRPKSGTRLSEGFFELKQDVPGRVCVDGGVLPEPRKTSRPRRLKLLARFLKNRQPPKCATMIEETDWTDDDDDDGAWDDAYPEGREEGDAQWGHGQSKCYLHQTSEASLLAAARREERALRVSAPPDAQDGKSEPVAAPPVVRSSLEPDEVFDPTGVPAKLLTDRSRSALLRPDSRGRAVRVPSSFLPTRFHQLFLPRGWPGRALPRAQGTGTRSTQAARTAIEGGRGGQPRSYLSAATGSPLHCPVKAAWVAKGSTEMNTALPTGAAGQTVSGHSLLSVCKAQPVSLFRGESCRTKDAVPSKAEHVETPSRESTRRCSDEMKRETEENREEELEAVEPPVELEQSETKDQTPVSTAEESCTRASASRLTKLSADGTTITGLPGHVIVRTAGSSSRDSRGTAFLCPNFSRGHCHWGDKCMFLHTLPLSARLSHVTSSSRAGRSPSGAKRDGTGSRAAKTPVAAAAKKALEDSEKKPTESVEARDSSARPTERGQTSLVREPRKRAEDFWPRGVCYWFACDFCWIGVACRQSHTTWDGSCLLCGAPEIGDRLERHLANCPEFHRRQEELHAAMKASCPACHGPLLPDTENTSDDERDSQRKTNVLAASGILSDCGHAFCCKCILGMGGENYRQENEVCCVLCGKVGIVIFTDRLIRDPVRFEEIRSKFLNYLKAKRCASYDLGFCRQGSNCRYGHYDASGYLVNSGGPKRRDDGSCRDTSDQAPVKATARSRSPSSVHGGVYAGGPGVHPLDVESDTGTGPSRGVNRADVAARALRCWLCAARNRAGEPCVCPTKTRRQDDRRHGGKDRGSSVHTWRPAVRDNGADAVAPLARPFSSRRARGVRLSRSSSIDGGGGGLQISTGHAESQRAGNLWRSRSRVKKGDFDTKGAGASYDAMARALSVQARSRGRQKRKEARDMESFASTDSEELPGVSRPRRSCLSQRRRRWVQQDEVEETSKRSQRRRSCRRRLAHAAGGRPGRGEDGRSVSRMSARGASRSRARESVDAKHGQNRDERDRRRRSGTSPEHTQEELSDEDSARSHWRPRRACSTRTTLQRDGAHPQIQNATGVSDNFVNEDGDEQVWPSALCYWFAWDFCWSGKKCDRAHVAFDGSCLLCNCENVGRNLDRHLEVCIEFIARQAEKRAAMTTECSICLGPMLPKTAGLDGFDVPEYLTRREEQESDTLPWQSCGALSSCGHTFCYRCIDQWVGTHPSSTDVRGDKQCPLCRRVGLIIPTNRLITNPVRFHMMKISFLKYLKSKRCPLFESGFCPQGLNCRHGHFDSSGRLITQEGLSYFAGMYLPAAPRSLPLDSLQALCAVPYQQYEEEYLVDYETPGVTSLPLFDYLGFATPQFHPYEAAPYAGETQPFM